MRRLALVIGVLLVLIPAVGVLRVFGGSYLGWSLVALLLFYGCILAGVAYQRRRGRAGGYFAFRGALQSVTIVAAIALFGPFVYGALTQTEVGNLAPMGGWIIWILGAIAAVGTGLIVYGAKGSDDRAIPVRT